MHALFMHTLNIFQTIEMFVSFPLKYNQNSTFSDHKICKKPLKEGNKIN